MKKLYFNLAGVVFTLEGDGAVFDSIANEFESVGCNDEQTLLNIEILDEHTNIETGVYAGPILASENAFRHACYLFSYQFARKGGVYSLEIVPSKECGWKKYVPTYIKRLREMSHLDRDEMTAKNIIYNCIDYIFQHILLSQKKTFVHASSGILSSRGVAFFALGGVGKSSSLLKLMHERGMQYLSDDLGIVSDSGDLFYNPKKIQVYAYNLQGQHWLRELLFNTMSLSSRVAWFLRLFRFGVKGVRRRVSVESIFGLGTVAKSSLLNCPLYLERVESTESSLRAASHDEFSKKIAYVVLEELKPFCEIALIYKSTFPDGKLLLSPPEMFDQIQKVVASALSRASMQPKCVYLAKDLTPDQMVAFFDANNLFDVK